MYSTLSADERLELDVIFAAERDEHIAVKQQPTTVTPPPVPAPARQPRPRFLFTLPYLNHFVRVSSAQAREFCGKTLGSMIVFIEINPHELRVLTDEHVVPAMEHLIDTLNEQSDITEEWTGSQFIQLDDVVFAALPDGYAISVAYSNDAAYEVMRQIRREKRRAGNRIAVHEF